LKHPLPYRVITTSLGAALVGKISSALAGLTTSGLFLYDFAHCVALGIGNPQPLFQILDPIKRTPATVRQHAIIAAAVSSNLSGPTCSRNAP